MVEGLQGRLAYPGEEIGEAETGVKPGTQHEGVDEAADQALDLRPFPVRHRGTHQEILLAGIAAEKALEGGEQDHERRDTVAPAVGRQTLVQAGSQREGLAATVLAALLGPWPVRRQLQHRQAPRQPVPPVGEVEARRLRFELPPLPARVVGVGDGQAGESRLRAFGVGGVEGGQLPQEDGERPAVGDDVVERRQQQVLTVVQRQQRHAAGRPRREIEGAPGLFPRDPPGLFLAAGRGQLTQVDP